MPQKRLEDILKEIKPRRKVEKSTIDRNVEPIFVEYEPLEEDYILVGRELVRIGPRHVATTIIGKIPDSAGFDFDLDRFTNKHICEIEEFFRNQALRLAKNKYKSHIAVAYKSVSDSELVNMANIWRTEVNISDIKPNTLLFKTTQVYADVVSQGEVFFYKRK